MPSSSTALQHMSCSPVHTQTHTPMARCRPAPQKPYSLSCSKRPSTHPHSAIHTHSRTHGTASGSNLGFSFLPKDQTTDCLTSRRTAWPPAGRQNWWPTQKLCSGRQSVRFYHILFCPFFQSDRTQKAHIRWLPQKNPATYHVSGGFTVLSCALQLQ